MSLLMCSAIKMIPIVSSPRSRTRSRRQILQISFTPAEHVSMPWPHVVARLNSSSSRLLKHFRRGQIYSAHGKGQIYRARLIPCEENKMGILLMARFTLQEAFHRWLLLAMVLLNILLLGVFALMLNSVYTSEVARAASEADPQLTLLEISLSISILSAWAVYLLSGALTIVLTVGMTSGEIEAGTF